MPDDSAKPQVITLLAAFIYGIDIVLNGTSNKAMEIAFKNAEEFVNFAEAKHPGVFDDG